jgi:endonuclease/exonuclease/phosphatase (EEP) superfamily protein YafD
MRFLLGAARVAVIAALAATVVVLTGISGASLHWSFDLAGQFLLPATVVGAAAAIAGALLRWWPVAIAAAVATALAFFVAVPWTSQPVAAPKEANRFTVLLFNVYWRNGKLADVREMVERTNADIVVLVEATARTRDAMQGLSALYPYKLDCIGSGGCDIMIFARSRLTPIAVAETSDAEHSPFVTTETEIAGCRMTLIATHMTRPFPNRPYGAQRAQAEEIGANVGAHAGAKLVLGDFNAAPWGYVIHTIAQNGAMKVLTGAGGTWPSALPPQLRIPIDNMIASEGLSFVSRRVLPKLGSDHLPVLAEIAVTDPAQCK